MKKRIIISFLVVISIILGLGGIAVAAAPDKKPIDTWVDILEKVNSIWNKVLEIESEVDVISANIPQMQTLEDGNTFTEPYEEFGNYEYDQLRHVVLTLDWAYIGLTP